MLAVLVSETPNTTQVPFRLQHAERRAERGAADRVEDQPERSVRLGGNQLAADHDALGTPIGHRSAVYVTSHMPPYDGAGRRGELAREMPDPARSAVDQNPAAEQQPALAQAVQRGQPGDRQSGGLGIADCLRQGRHRMAATIHPLGPGP
jgi:hypothetical protein